MPRPGLRPSCPAAAARPLRPCPCPASSRPMLCSSSPSSMVHLPMLTAQARRVPAAAPRSAMVAPCTLRSALRTALFSNLDCPDLFWQSSYSARDAPQEGVLVKRRSCIWSCTPANTSDASHIKHALRESSVHSISP